MRTKILAGAAIAAIVILGGSSCDVTEDRPKADPDAVSDATNVTVWRNVDDAPNVITFCADSLAFASTASVDGARNPALIRTPERDGRCAK